MKCSLGISNFLEEISSLSHSVLLLYFFALPFFGIGMKTDLSSPVATAEFSTFVGILIVALSQHHLLGFEIAQLESITSNIFVRINIS